MGVTVRQKVPGVGKTSGEKSPSKEPDLKSTEPEGDCYLDLARLAAYSSLGKSTLKDLIRRGEIPTYQPSRKVLVKKSEFDHWVSKHKIKAFDRVREIVDDIMRKFKSKGKNQ